MFNETPVSLCNRALGILGVERTISNPSFLDDPASDAVWEQRCSQVYRRTLQLSLALFMPTFALTPHPVKITQTGDGRWLIPAESLKIISADGHSGDDIHEIGGEIKMDIPPLDQTIEVEYIRMVEQTGLWSPEFQNLFPYELAVELAVFLSDAGKLTTAIQLRDRKRAECGGLNAQRVRMKRRYKPLWKHKWPFPIR